MARYGGYRLRNLLAFGGGLMFLGSYFGYYLTPWAPVPMAGITGAAMGFLLKEGNNGAGAGGLAAALGGALFVAVLNYRFGVVPVVSRSMFGFVLLGGTGMVSGGITGYVLGRFVGDDDEEAGEDDGDDAAAGG